MGGGGGESFSILSLIRYKTASISDTESVIVCLQHYNVLLNPRLSEDGHDIINHGPGTLNLLQDNITISKVSTCKHLRATKFDFYTLTLLHNNIKFCNEELMVNNNTVVDWDNYLHTKLKF
jgi:hypothetical protein